MVETNLPRMIREIAAIPSKLMEVPKDSLNHNKGKLQQRQGAKTHTQHVSTAFQTH